MTRPVRGLIKLARKKAAAVRLFLYRSTAAAGEKITHVQTISENRRLNRGRSGSSRRPPFRTRASDTETHKAKRARARPADHNRTELRQRRTREAGARCAFPLSVMLTQGRRSAADHPGPRTNQTRPNRQRHSFSLVRYARACFCAFSVRFFSPLRARMRGTTKR